MADSLDRVKVACQRIQPFAVVALRWVVGAVFIFSGFVKGIDLWGVIYKVTDYINAFGWNWALPYVDVVAVMMPLAEFTIGFLLFIGSFRRVAVWLFSTAVALFVCRGRLPRPHVAACPFLARRRRMGGTCPCAAALISVQSVDR